jgi:hypothetical protein
MSDQSDIPREMPPLVTANPAGLTTFEYFSEHIAAISALVTVFVGLGSTCMLFGYIVALDGGLLRLIQYTDVLQFGLETVVFLGFGLALVSVYVAAVRWMQQRRKDAHEPDSPWTVVATGIVLLPVSLFYAWGTNRDSPGAWFRDLVSLFFYAVGIAVIFLYLPNTWKRRPVIVVFFRANLILIFIAVGAATKGAVLGMGKTYDVSANQQFDDVIIALTLGRGTVLYDHKAEHTLSFASQISGRSFRMGKRAGWTIFLINPGTPRAQVSASQ